MYAVVRNGRFSGTVYDEISDAIIAFHAAQGECICPVDVPPANVGTEENPQYADLTIAEMKIAKKAEIAAARYAVETAPYYFEAKGAYFDTSERSQIKVKDAIAAGLTVDWKTIDGTWVSMSPQDFTDLNVAYWLYVAGLFVMEKDLSDRVSAIDDMTGTVEDFARIDPVAEFEALRNTVL